MKYLFLLCWGVGHVLLGGFVLARLWEWFVAPPFHLPPLSLGAAIGLSLVVGYLTIQVPANRAEADRVDSIYQALYASSAMVYFLVYGVLLHLVIS